MCQIGLGKKRANKSNGSFLMGGDADIQNFLCRVSPNLGVTDDDESFAFPGKNCRWPTIAPFIARSQAGGHDDVIGKSRSTLKPPRISKTQHH